MFINNSLGQNENLLHRDIKNDIGIMQLIPGAICPYNKINGTVFFNIFFIHWPFFFNGLLIFFWLKGKCIKNNEIDSKLEWETGTNKTNSSLPQNVFEWYCI